MSGAALTLEGVGKAFGGVPAAADVSFAVPAGSVTGIMGPSGAGKSVLADLIGGRIRPDGGRIMLGDAPIAGLSPQSIARMGVGRSWQRITMAPGLSALEQVVAGCWLQREVSMLASVLHLPGAQRRRQAIEEQALWLLGRLGMADRADVLAEALGWGEQRRVEIARTLGAAPGLLILDEPLAGLHPPEAARVTELIAALRGDGVTVLVLAQSMRVISELCDHAVVLIGGRKVVEGTAAHCIDNQAVQDAYFGRQVDAHGQ